MKNTKYQNKKYHRLKAIYKRKVSTVKKLSQLFQLQLDTFASYMSKEETYNKLDVITDTINSIRQEAQTRSEYKEKDFPIYFEHYTYDVNKLKTHKPKTHLSIKQVETALAYYDKGWDIERCFYGGVGLKRRNKETEKDIFELFNEIDRGNFESAKKLLSKLTEQLGDNDVDLMDAKTTIELYGN